MVQSRDVNDDCVNKWVEALIKVYVDVADKYSLSNDDILQYMYTKDERNVNSHFSDVLTEYAERYPQGSFIDFLTQHTNLLDIFNQDEINRLSPAFDRCCQFNRSTFKLVTLIRQYYIMLLMNRYNVFRFYADDKVTIRPGINPNVVSNCSEYNLFFFLVSL